MAPAQQYKGCGRGRSPPPRPFGGRASADGPQHRANPVQGYLRGVGVLVAYRCYFLPTLSVQWAIRGLAAGPRRRPHRLLTPRAGRPGPPSSCATPGRVPRPGRADGGVAWSSDSWRTKCAVAFRRRHIGAPGQRAPVARALRRSVGGPHGARPPSSPRPCQTTPTVSTTAAGSNPRSSPRPPAGAALQSPPRSRPRRSLVRRPPVFFFGALRGSASLSPAAPRSTAGAPVSGAT